jgi:enoyl-CoA hydratase/carnithine racemase
MEQPKIKKEVENRILIIYLQDEKTRNAMSLDVIQQLTSIFNEASDSKEIGCIILTSAIDGIFSSGANLKELYKFSILEMREYQDILEKLENSIEFNKKPVIAAVNGYALGGGNEICLCCDFVIASEKAKFGQPEINIGILPGMGGVQRLIRHIGILKAKELVMTGRMIDAYEAEKIGLVNKVVHHEKLMEEAKKLASELIGKPKLALWMAKHQINTAREADLRTALLLEKAIVNFLFGTPDKEEGMKAFIEKRKPKFS